MTNRDAISLLEEVKILDDTMYAYNPSYLEALDMALTALEAEETWYATHEYPPKQRWIPCSERLPEEKDAGILKKLGTEKRSEYVLATVEVKGERMTVTACTYDGAWDWNMKYTFPDFKVIAWMPLPEPYRREMDG